MVATIFDARGAVAVLAIDETAAGNVAFANGNSWRGDEFENRLRAAIAIYDDAPRMPDPRALVASQITP